MRKSLSPRDYGLLAILTLLWGANWPVMKLGVADFPPMAFRAISTVGGMAFLALVARWQGVSLRIDREHWREVFVLAMTNMAIWFVLAIYAIRILSSGRAAILGYTMPVWTALIGIAFYGDRLGALTWLGVAAAAAAVMLLMSSEIGMLTGSPLGTLLMLAGAVCWAIGTQFMRRRRVKAPLVALTFWMLVVTLATSALIALLFERRQWVRPPNAVEWGALLYNMVLVLGVSQLVWFRVATILTPVASGLSVMLIPVVGLFSGMLVLGEQPGWRDFAALAFVTVSIATVLLPQRVAPGAAQPERAADR